ncbi:hypothetical protein E2562_034546 [Oryza meyeriana var. granulata]|uniref:Uncharacterized protein n=1 Tax=Oryza meyeriana var. granulata TaxID=110450 RepID=A0A6G1EDA4_9ORYZ|nr:hypothetical protein E2562_034546 [Oryza meyeriana var. granulata]
MRALALSATAARSVVTEMADVGSTSHEVISARSGPHMAVGGGSPSVVDPVVPRLTWPPLPLLLVLRGRQTRRSVRCGQRGSGPSAVGSRSAFTKVADAGSAPSAVACSRAAATPQALHGRHSRAATRSAPTTITEPWPAP